MIKPIYTHDCDACEFHGQAAHEGHLFDLYHCKGEIFSKDTGGSLVARAGDDGPDYMSMPRQVIEQMEGKRPADHPLIALNRLIKAKEKREAEKSLALGSLAPLL